MTPEEIKVQEEIMSEMKQMLKEKTTCMIASYKDVLDNTAKMFRDTDARDVSDDEIAKRADMFWTIALQKIEREHGEAFARQAALRNGEPVALDPAVVAQYNKRAMEQQQGETPCAKRARESAEKIAALQAEVDTMNQQKDILKKL